jgi:hypothetical protein
MRGLFHVLSLMRSITGHVPVQRFVAFGLTRYWFVSITLGGLHGGTWGVEGTSGLTIRQSHAHNLTREGLVL